MKTNKQWNQLLQPNVTFEERWFYNICILHGLRSVLCSRGEWSQPVGWATCPVFCVLSVPLTGGGHFIAEVSLWLRGTTVRCYHSGVWAWCSSSRLPLIFPSDGHSFTPSRRLTTEKQTRAGLGLGQCPACGYKTFTPDVRPREEMERRGREAWRDTGEGRTASWNVAARRRGELGQDWKRETSASARRAWAAARRPGEAGEAGTVRPPKRTNETWAAFLQGRWLTSGACQKKENALGEHVNLALWPLLSPFSHTVWFPQISGWGARFF